MRVNVQITENVEQANIQYGKVELTHALRPCDENKIWVYNGSEGMYIPEQVISDLLNKWMEENF